MPKKVFWPLAMIAMGLIVLSSNFGLLPREFRNLWPMILVVAGLGGLLTSDRDEWMYPEPKSETKSRSIKKAVSKKKK